MITTPKGLRLHIGVFGRTNVGKSSFINLVTGQEVSIVSDIPGTTTDVVEKAMEILPIGPVLFLDTAGIDDETLLGKERVRKAFEVLRRCDVALLMLEPNVFTEFESSLIKLFEEKKIPYVVVINKIDVQKPEKEFLKNFEEKKIPVIEICALKNKREDILAKLKTALLKVVPEEFLREPQLIGDLVPPGGIAVLVVPIDLEAPKGRLILPQVQTIRNVLDSDATAIVVKERELPYLLSVLNRKSDVIVCDSQVVLKVAGDVPQGVKFTTFSILFSRYKGDIVEFAKGLHALKNLKEGAKVLIAEACTHHPIEDDIGRVKIPRWIRQYTGLKDISFSFHSGRSYPEDLSEYDLVVHCGACTLNRREMLSRIELAKSKNVPITNYGMCISLVQGVIEKVLEPFPAALLAFRNQFGRKKYDYRNRRSCKILDA
ncbi:small GTP-binding protein [Desulfurobacterium thermolithotrophum DSM 11699]|uniref:Small GTP-binding protein n=1 Tax=Desulfurobacterium thermolithotrophum (strain DSM 11699 / BSA) TaxID=868864 RepID=F0S0Z7_DESTD|nr:[FeFe] hydrogenase H-cluster maturation GTPase HydF [Desulfurobacterium thermolithotrophum]ADY72801.1 small GTP-binding protein [Desulfurobacterium thermolithotrophum DSM 11699]